MSFFFSFVFFCLFLCVRVVCLGREREEGPCVRSKPVHTGTC